MDWGKLLTALVPVGITLAESIHPGAGQGNTKLATATTFIQMGLGLATAAGAIPPGKATDAVTIAQQINAAVAKANAAGGVPTVDKLPAIPHGPSTTPQ